MGLTVLIIIVGPVFSLVLLVVLIHPEDVFFVCLDSDLLNCKECISVQDCWIDRCERRALLIL